MSVEQVQLHSFVTSPLDRSEWSASHPDHTPLRKDMWVTTEWENGWCQNPYQSFGQDTRFLPCQDITDWKATRKKHSSAVLYIVYSMLFSCTLYTIHSVQFSCTVHHMQYIVQLYTVHYTWYTVQLYCTPYAVYCSAVYCTLHMVYCSAVLYTICSILLSCRIARRSSEK